MLNKRMMILAIFLAGLLAVSAVSAADNATSDIAGADDSADQVDSAIEEENFDSSNASEGDDFESPAPVAIDDEDGKLGMSDDGEILGSEIHVRGDEFARIQVAIHQANDGDIIYLDSVTYTSTGSSIIISKSITLVGQEGTVLDAQGESGICVVQADNVVIKNIKFINAKYVKGSAIDIGGDSNFSLSNCTFINNTAEVGGAIYWPAADGSITNCTFIGNSADYGGAMYTGGDGGEISNCVFINNNANHGKALDARSYSKIYDSYFKNIPFLDITDEDSSLTLTLMTNLDYSGTVFTSITKKENLKYWNGSAYVNGDDPNFGTLQYPDKNVTLEVYHSNGELAYRVSNFTDSNGQIIFDYSKFNDDRYVYKAYAFDDDSNFISATGRLNDNIGDFTLLQNYINNVGENGTVNLTRDYTFTDGLDDNLKKGIIIPFNLTICGNGYTINGAKSARIFNVTGNNVAIHGIKFINGEGGDGGAIYVNGGCTLINCIFTNNHALNDGGAVYWNTNAVGITNCTFENNTARKYGGANYFYQSVTNVTLTGNFTNNRAEMDYGGANYFNDEVTDVTLTGNFNNNTATKSGGGANCFNNEVNNVALTGNFTNNRAEMDYGGANYFNNEVNNVTLTGNFNDNTAQAGGANYFKGAVNNVTLTGNFTSNYAEFHGGANYFWVAVNNVNLTGNFTNNRAEKYYGGANYFYQAVNNAILTGNFTNNTAKEYGGANYFLRTVDNITLTGTFINNQAENGAANAFVDSVTDVTLTGNYINNAGENVIHIWNSTSNNVIRDSIFINNAPINVTNGNIDVIDNWFGNNVTNYNVKPEVGIDLDNWLFLNGTADPNPVSVANTTNIIFTLSRYDGKNVSSYDNSRLIPIKLDITSTLGSVNPNLVNLNESITYTPESVGNGSITASFENVLCTIEIENQKAEPDMSIESYPSYAGENTTITVTLPQDATGNVTVTDADGNNYTKPVKDGAADIEVPKLNAGINKLNITYSGDEYYLPKTVEYEVQVDKMPTSLLVENIEMYQGDGTKYVVNLTDRNGNPVAGMGIKVNITGKTYTIITDENGTAVLPINLKAGIHPAVAFFNGKGDYANATPVSTNVSVLTKVRIDQHKDLVKDYGDADKFTVHAVDKYGKSVGVNAKVKMTVAGKTYTVFTDAQGYASLPINLKPGTYDITCEYAGYTVTHKITVKQVLSATNRQYKKANSYQFTAMLKHTNGNTISGKTVTFTFKGKTYTQNTNSKGEATITIKEALNIGKYNISIKYIDSTITKSITIK